MQADAITTNYSRRIILLNFCMLLLFTLNVMFVLIVLSGFCTHVLKHERGGVTAIDGEFISILSCFLVYHLYWKTSVSAYLFWLDHILPVALVVVNMCVVVHCIILCALIFIITLFYSFAIYHIIFRQFVLKCYWSNIWCCMLYMDFLNVEQKFQCNILAYKLLTTN